MSQQNHPKQQHFVPQFLLRGFTSGKKGQLFAFDKHTQRVFKTTPRNIAAGKGFYDLKVPAGVLTLEPALAKLEETAAPIVKQVRRQESLASLTPSDREILAAAWAVQFVRTQNKRENLLHLSQQMAAHFRELGIDPGTISNFKEMDAEDAKLVSLRLTLDAGEFIPYFLNKSWALARNRSSKPFWISDNPVALHNSVDHGFYGNLGLGVTGIQIYMPISSTLCLGMFCKSHEAKAREGVAEAESLCRVLPVVRERVEALTRGARELIAAFEARSVLEYSPDNVVHHNSLQVISAERYVFSSTDDFSLARRMLADHPALAGGPRGQLA